MIIEVTYTCGSHRNTFFESVSESCDLASHARKMVSKLKSDYKHLEFTGFMFRGVNLRSLDRKST